MELFLIFSIFSILLTFNAIGENPRFEPLPDEISKDYLPKRIESNLKGINCSAKNLGRCIPLFPLIQLSLHNTIITCEELKKEKGAEFCPTEKQLFEILSSEEYLKKIYPPLIEDEPLKENDKKLEYYKLGNARYGECMLGRLLSKANIQQNPKYKNLRTFGKGEKPNECFFNLFPKQSRSNSFVLTQIFNPKGQDLDDYLREREFLKLLNLSIHYLFSAAGWGDINLENEKLKFLNEIITEYTKTEDPYIIPHYFAILAGVSYDELDKIRIILKQSVRIQKKKIPITDAPIRNPADCGFLQALSKDRGSF